jgi:hypothetical protein
VNPLTFLKYRGFQIYYDLVNIKKYGQEAPRYAELMFFNPFPDMSVSRGGAGYGRIVCEMPPTCIETVASITPVREVLLRYRDGLTWRETGLYARMERQLRHRGYVDGCRSMKDVFKRYRALDQLYDETQRTGRLKTQKELNLLSVRELGGITLHVNSEGELIFSRVGQHRFAIALALNLKNVPFAVGSVHICTALCFDKLRERFKSRYLLEAAPPI